MKKATKTMFQLKYATLIFLFGIVGLIHGIWKINFFTGLSVPIAVYLFYKIEQAM